MSQPATGPLSTDLENPDAVPYFLWDEPMTVAELKVRLAAGTPFERGRLLGKVLREGRDEEVWRFTTPEEVQREWRRISLHLGRRRAFWEYLLGQWRRLWLISVPAAG